MPKYKFYQRLSNNKSEEVVKGVDRKFRSLRLLGLSINPFDQRFNLRIEIYINSSTKPYMYLVSKLFHNPKLEPSLFFIYGDKQYRDVPLPEGENEITIKAIAMPGTKDFELSLDCEFIEEK